MGLPEVNSNLLGPIMYLIHPDPPYLPHKERDTAFDNRNYWITMQGCSILTLCPLL